MDPLLGTQFPFATLFFAVIFTTWYGGLRPAVAAVVLGAVAVDVLPMPPYGWFQLATDSERYGLLLYLITGFGISVLGGKMHSGYEDAASRLEASRLAERNSRAFNLELEARVADRTARLSEQAQILDLAHDTIFIRDVNDRVIYWNEGATRLYGFSKDEAMGEIAHLLLATQFPQPLEVIRLHVLAHGSWSGELVHRRRDGTLVNVASNWTLRRDASSRPVSTIEMNFDITERKKAEMEKEKSRLQLNAIFRNSRDGIMVLEAVRDADGMLKDLAFVMVNPAAEILARSNASELTDQRLCEKVPSVISDGLFEKYARTIAENTDLELDYETSRDGKPRWLRISAVKMGDGLVVSYRDITAKKLAENQRQLLVSRLGVATGILRVGVWEWDVATQAVQWDERMYETYGLPADMAINYDVWSNAVVPEDLPGAAAELRRAIDSKSQNSMEFRIRLPNGGIRHIQSAYGTILDDSGEVARVVGVNTDVTERRKSEERFQLVVEAEPNAMVLVGPDGLMTLVNTQAEKLFGYSRSQLLGQPVEMLLPERLRIDHRRHRSEFNGAWVARDAGEQKDLYALRSDGVEVPVEIGLNPIHTEEGRSVLASVVDITERSKVEGYLKLLSTLIESAKDYAIFMLDAGGCVLTWNQGAERIKGYTRDEILGKHLSSFYTVEDVKLGRPENGLRIARDQGRFEDEGWRVRKDGSTFWASGLITAVYNQRGELRGFSKITRDRTEQRITEERFQTVVEASPSALVMVSHDGLITLVNRQTERLLGYDRAELLGRNVEMLVPARLRATHREQRNAFNQSPAARAMGAGANLIALRKDGYEVPVEIGMNPITTGEGEFVLASIIDVTERKRYENELHTKAAEMERFTYTVSHDLKSPLITIKSFISMIDLDIAAGKLDRIGNDLQRVSKAADRMQMLLEEVLALSRVGRVENAPETVNLAALVSEALELVAGRIAANHIHVEVDENLPFVTVYRNRMVEALQNLIDNATKFMGEQREPEIRIGVQRDGYETRFYVRDNGAGIDTKHHERIFGLFDKLNPKSEGSGAGLAIVKRIIELHGGRIWVESSGKGGSTFWFTLDERLPTAVEGWSGDK